jgi:hypothetical protein
MVMVVGPDDPLPPQPASTGLAANASTATNGKTNANNTHREITLFTLVLITPALLGIGDPLPAVIFMT